MSADANRAASLHRIVIVGGGAGGLELATHLGERLGRRGRAAVTLIDRARTHVWKPLLHKVAAGTMDPGDHALDYLAQAHWHGFRYQQGEMVGLDRASRRVNLAPVVDEEGATVVPARSVSYDTLVLAIGSQTNDFGTPGAARYAISLDSAEQAARFHARLLNTCLRADLEPGAGPPGALGIAIIGAGATGIELSAELHKMVRELVAYGLDRIDAERDLKLTIIEAAPRILPALPERLANATLRLLTRLKVEVLTGERVVEVDALGVRTASGRRVPAALVIWAAGVKAPDFLKDLAGLETNRLNQLVVTPSLRTTRDPAIFALGDCAACPWAGREGTVPPRAQAAHQQASHLARALPRLLAGRPVPSWRYRDFGSLVSLGRYSTVGSLMDSITRGSLMIEGLFARLMYLSLYKMHELALHGPTKVVLDTLARLITRRTEPQIKLH
ncbi:MAG TPA: NAD(P)/FAD-dependent oxidoreductase [Steroidobacteraceae bacterium]|nr:NAD(P)/FAD-dependent oxidoreductase [Steroidobacteraceae bacterium]